MKTIITIIILAIAMLAISMWDTKNEETRKVTYNQFYDTAVAGWMAPTYVETEVRATLTGYSSTPEETDDTPYLMANGETVRLGVIACPRDIPFGTMIIYDGREYTCSDRMSLKYPDRFDIWFPSKEEALEFGKKVEDIKIINFNH